jgi:hypothetical protein
MKWEKFKTLTTEQREEYMFKFSNTPQIGVNGYFLTVTNFVLIILVIMIMYYIVMKDSTFSKIAPQVQIMFSNVILLSKYSLAIGIVYSFFMVANILIFWITRYIWIRKNTRK